MTTTSIHVISINMCWFYKIFGRKEKQLLEYSWDILWGESMQWLWERSEHAMLVLQGRKKNIDQRGLELIKIVKSKTLSYTNRQ